jgi:hypothetical protein
MRPMTPIMQHVEDRERSSMPMMAIFAVLLILAGGGWFIWQRSSSKSGNEIVVAQNVAAPKPTPAPAAVPPVPVAAVAPAVPKPAPPPKPVAAPRPAVAEAKPVQAAPPAPAPVAQVEDSATPAQPVSHQEVLASKPAPAAPVPVDVPPAPAPVRQFPAIKLQGIFYSSVNPTAMLNGKNLHVGSKLEGVVVAKIEPLAVTLEWNGETKVLELPQ